MGGGAPGGEGGGMPGGGAGGAPGGSGAGCPVVHGRRCTWRWNAGRRYKRCRRRSAPGQQKGGGIKRVERGVNDFENRDDSRHQKHGRASVVLGTSMAHRWIAGLLYNWMGDQGWLQRIGRDMMDLPPGANKAVNYQASPTLIPSIPQKLYPKLFEQIPVS